MLKLKYYSPRYHQQLKPQSYIMDRLTMLSQREQLMEDIDCIIEANFGEVEYKDDVIRQLCDAVCKNFPTNWFSLTDSH